MSRRHLRSQSREQHRQRVGQPKLGRGGYVFGTRSFAPPGGEAQITANGCCGIEKRVFGISLSAALDWVRTIVRCGGGIRCECLFLVL